MKNEEEEDQLLVELCYNYHFHSGDSLILDHHHCEKNFSKIFNQSKDIKQSLLLIDCQMAVFCIAFCSFLLLHGVNQQ